MTEIAKQQKSYNDDRISALPDSLLHHILSFLEFKEVMATSILSKRWTLLWTAVPNLDLHIWDSYRDDHPDFPGFVIQSLMLNDSLMLYDNPKIRKFCVTFQLDRYSFEDSFDHVRSSTDNAWSDRHIDSLIQFATEHHAEELHLRFYHDIEMDMYYEVPQFLFDCGSLEVLRFRDCQLDLPSPLRLCLLTKLQLHHVMLSDLDTSCCPALKSLILKDCNPHGLLKIYAPNQKLEYLKIDDSNTSFVDDDNNSLTLFAPNLISIRFNGRLRQGYNIQNLSSLKNAFLEFDKSYEHAQYLMELLVYVSHASTLQLGPNCIQVLLPPVRATCLVLHTCMKKSVLLGMASILSSSHNLESLIIHTMDSITPMKNWHLDFDEACGSLEHSLSTNRHLKVVKISSFLQRDFLSGGEAPEPSNDIDRFLEKWEKEITLMKLLLNSCMVLEKLIICTAKIPASWRLKSEFLLGLTKRLISFPRASVNAEIHLLESASMCECCSLYFR